MSKEAMKLALEALENSADLVSNEAREAEKMYANVPTRLARVQGLVALEVAHEKAITALREELAEQPAQQEPVAAQSVMTVRIWRDKNSDQNAEFKNWHKLPDGEHILYTSPPAQRKPLTDEEIGECIDKVNTTSQYSHHHFGWHLQFARAIEAAHGIGEKK